MLFLLELLSAELKPIKSLAFSSSTCCWRLLSVFPSAALPRDSEPEAGFNRSFSFIICLFWDGSKTEFELYYNYTLICTVFKRWVWDGGVWEGLPVRPEPYDCLSSQPSRSPARSRCCCDTPNREEPGSDPSSLHCSSLPTDTPQEKRIVTLGNVNWILTMLFLFLFNKKKWMKKKKNAFGSTKSAY